MLLILARRFPCKVCGSLITAVTVEMISATTH